MKMSILIKFSFILLPLFWPLPAPGYSQKENLLFAYSSIGATSIPVWIAEDKGFFSRNGLDPTLIYIGGGRVVAQAFAAGQVKMAQLAGPAFVSANLSGLNLRMVVGLVNTSTFTLFVKPHITTMKGLKGKKLGLGSFGGSPDFISRYMLRKYGLEPEKDVTILQLGAGGDIMRFAALKGGSIDGALFSPPHTALAREAGFRALVTPETLPIPYQAAGVATTAEFAEKNRDIVKRFVKAVVEAIHFYKTQKQESLTLIARRLNVTDRSALEEMYREFAQKLHPQKPYPTVDGIAFILESQKDRIPPGVVVRAEDFVDMHFVRELDESGFIDRLYTR